MKHQLEVAKTNVVPAAQALTFQNQWTLKRALPSMIPWAIA
jgi:hypothetical protein